MLWRLLMKLSHLIFALLLSALLLPAAASAQNSSDKPSVTIRVDGLSCPFCAYGLEKKLKKLDGVENLNIKINEGLAILTFASAAKIDTVIIAKKVNEAGFTAGKMTVKTPGEAKPAGKKIALSIKGMTCESCSSRVEKALAAVDCVSDVHVNLKAATASVQCSDANGRTDKLVEAVEKLGFEARVVEQ